MCSRTGRKGSTVSDSPIIDNLDDVKRFYAQKPPMEDITSLEDTEPFLDDIPTEEKSVHIAAQRKLIREVVGDATEDEIKAAGLGYVDTDSDPSPKPGARRLRRYWTRGPGAAKIKWGVAGDFKRCVRQLREHVGPGAEGLCQVYHVSATGHAPGRGPHAGKSLRQTLLPLGDDLGLLVEGIPLSFAGEDGTSVKAVDEGALSDAGSVAPSHVLTAGDKFKVFGSDAIAYPAHVIDLKSLGNLPDELTVGSSVSHASGVLAASLEEPVTLLVKSAGPDPVTISLNDMEAKQFASASAFAGVEGFEFDASSSLVVVPGAKSLGEVRLGASVKSAGSHTVHNTLILHRMTNEQFSELVSATGHAPGKGHHVGKSAMVADQETKVLHVEEEGLALDNLFLSKAIFTEWERIEGKSGRTYDVGYNVLTELWEAHNAKNFSDVIVASAQEDDLYRVLNTIDQDTEKG